MNMRQAKKLYRSKHLLSVPCLECKGDSKHREQHRCCTSGRVTVYLVKPGLRGFVRSLDIMNPTGKLAVLVGG